VAEIDALVATLKTEAQKARAEKLASQSLWRAITGEGQIGGNMSTGSSNTANLTLGLKLSAETLRWKQTLAFTADYEKENGVLSQEDYSAGYEVRYKFTSRTYALGTLVWDRDPFDGYSDRGAASIGLGYKLIDRPNISFSLDIGPAVRSVAYVATPDEPAFDRTEAAARAGAAFSWTIIPKTVLTETLATYVQSADKNFNSTTAITTKLAGALSARLSFQVQYDSLLPPGYDSIDTTTRLTMVYGF
jgi:putative salt-induced outer membrane protein